jgi:hypothetical protein
VTFKNMSFTREEILQQKTKMVIDLDKLEIFNNNYQRAENVLFDSINNRKTVS